MFYRQQGKSTLLSFRISNFRRRGKLRTFKFEPPLSTVGECVALKAISSLPDSYSLADGEW